MSNIIFFSFPSHGHLNPSLAVIRELVKRKHVVLCYAIAEFKKEVEATGATYIAYPPYKDIDLRLAKHFVLAAYEELVLTNYLSKVLSQRIASSQVDCILHDSLAVWGKAIASKLNIPAVCLTTTFSFNKRMWQLHPKSILLQHLKFLRFPKKTIKLLSLYKKLREQYHLRDGFYDIFTNKEKLTIVFTSSFFQPYANSFDSSFQFIGPAVSKRNDDTLQFKQLPKNRPLIYISLGTIYNDDLSFFKMCLKIFEKTDYTIIISLGHRFTKTQLENIPKNVIVKNYVPQLEVLQKASLFITHAGMNSVNESLYFGVPMVLVPQMDEQVMNAIRVKQLGAGILLNKSNLNQKKLLDAIKKVMNSNSYKKNAEKIQKTLIAAGGYKKGADEIEKYIKS